MQAVVVEEIDLLMVDQQDLEELFLVSRPLLLKQIDLELVMVEIQHSVQQQILVLAVELLIRELMVQTVVVE
tara:strand:+ start:289 stop:504 length:216 start_codon:yes stop_codon:yes gene_type:complete